MHLDTREGSLEIDVQLVLLHLVYICKYIDKYTYTHMYIYIYTYLCIHVFKYISPGHERKVPWNRRWTCSPMHKYVHIYINIHTHICMYTYIRICIYIRKYMHLDARERSLEIDVELVLLHFSHEERDVRGISVLQTPKMNHT